MKVETKAFSKKALVGLVDIIREKNFLPESIFVAWYRNDLVTQLNQTQKDLEAIEKQFQQKRLPRKVQNGLVRKYKSLAVTGNKKIAILKELDNAAE